MSLITQLILPLKNVALVDFVANPLINTLNIIAKFIPPLSSRTCLWSLWRMFDIGQATSAHFNLGLPTQIRNITRPYC